MIHSTDLAEYLIENPLVCVFLIDYIETTEAKRGNVIRLKPSEVAGFIINNEYALPFDPFSDSVRDYAVNTIIDIFINMVSQSTSEYFVRIDDDGMLRYFQEYYYDSIDNDIHPHRLDAEITTRVTNNVLYVVEINIFPGIPLN